MFTGQTKSKRPATFGILYQVVACSVVADSCEGTWSRLVPQPLVKVSDL